MNSKNGVRRWWPALAGGAALGAAAVLGTGVIPSPAADDKPAEKKAPETKPAFKPDDVRVGAPPELEALRKAVERAGKKGENVDEIRQHLEALEKAMTGRAWVKPQPPVEIVRPGQPPREVFPALPDVGGADVDALRRIMEEQQRLMREALGGRIAGVGGLPGVPGIGVGPADPLMGRRFMMGMSRGEGRLGVRLEQVPLVVADQLLLPAGRGLVVMEVMPGSAAEKAGIKASDILLEFEGLAITNDAADLVKRVNDAKAGEKIDVVVMRKGKKESLKVELSEMKRRQVQAAPFDGLGGLGGGNAIRFSNNNGMIEIQASQDGVVYGVKGEMLDGKLNAREITITEGGNTTTYDSIDKVPEGHRTKVQNLMGKPGKRVD